MAKITSEILKAIAPGTKQELRDRFLPSLNLTLPVYGIDSALELAGFLATACFESDHFKTLTEYGKGKGHPYGKPDKITGLIYYGRGIFQNTWKKGYQDFTDYVAAHWPTIKERAGIEEPPDFVLEPDLLATTFWAVEAACWYWQRNGLAKYARQGTDGFFALQGLVNRGSATKRALDYPDRLKIYEAARHVLPDSFSLNGTQISAPPATKTIQPDPNVSGQTSPSEEPNNQTVDLKAEITPQGGVKVESSQPNNAPKERVAVVKAAPQQWYEAAWTKIVAFISGNAVFQWVWGQLDTFQSLHIPVAVWYIVSGGAVVGGLFWIGSDILETRRANERQKEIDQLLVTQNSTVDNLVQLIPHDEVDLYRARGFKIITRGDAGSPQPTGATL